MSDKLDHCNKRESEAEILRIAGEDGQKSLGPSPKKPRTCVPVLYQGFHPISDTWKPDRIADDIDPSDFYAKYVATRTPCIITGSKIVAKIAETIGSLEYLNEQVGDADVQVEREYNGRFGSGSPRITKKLSDFIKALETDSQLYLTTQYGSDGPDDLEETIASRLREVFQAPLHQLVQKQMKQSTDSVELPFPLDAPMLPTLAVQQLTLWIGAKNGSSSGLHHDYADNMYLLLRGRKQFKIFSPMDIPSMRLAGPLYRIARNGLAMHQLGVRDDGANIINVARAKVYAQDSEQEESLLDAVSDASSGMFDNDLAESDEESLEDESQEDSEDDDEAMAEIAQLMKQPGVLSKFMGEGSLEQLIKSTANVEEPKFQGMPDKLEKLPPSFSEYETAAKALAAHAGTCIEFDLNAGEMLYLPASWMHEVVSYEELHIAINYWLHPPTTESYAEPYPDAYWNDQWALLKDLVANS